MQPRTLHRLLTLFLLFGLILAATIVPFHRVPSTCPLFNITGMPCPFCKMTSSWSLFLRGQFMQSIATNPYGVLFLLAAFSAIAYFAYVLIARHPGFDTAGWFQRHRWLVRSFIFLWAINWIWVIIRFNDW